MKLNFTKIYVKTYFRNETKSKQEPIKTIFIDSESVATYDIFVVPGAGKLL